MDVLDYLRILRRRWRLIAVLCLVGVVLGGASVRVGGGDDQTFYRATHTLATNGSGVNLDQAAALAVTGAVPDRVAARVEGSPAELAAQVRVVARREVSFIEVTALGTDPARTVALADAFADELSLYMTEFRNQSASTELEAAESRLVDVETELAQQQAALAATADPLEQVALTAQVEALQAEVAQLSSQISRLQATAEGATVLQTVSGAQAVPINGPEFRALFQSDSTSGSAEADPRCRRERRRPSSGCSPASCWVACSACWWAWWSPSCSSGSTPACAPSPRSRRPSAGPSSPRSPR